MNSLRVNSKRASAQNVSPAVQIGRVLASVGVLGLLAGVVLHFQLATYSYLAFAFAGSFVIHIRSATVPSGSWFAALLLGGAYGALYVVLGRPVNWLNCVGFLGVGSVAVLGIAAIWSRFQSPGTLVLVGLLPALQIYSGFLHAYTLVKHPTTHDLYLYDFDARLGFQPSFAMGRLFHCFGLIRQASFIAYESLPLWMAVAFSLERDGKRRHTADIVKAFLAAGIAGYLIYNLIPATGPVHVFREGFPFSPPPPPIPHPVSIPAAPRNAMPSVHLAMALLIFWHSRPWRLAVRIFAGALLLFTVLATLGFGEHYLIDLVVAVPFALTVETIATYGSRQTFRLRIASAIAGTSMCAAWILYLLRWAQSDHLPAALLACVEAATVICALMFESALHRAQKAVARESGRLVPPALKSLGAGELA